MVAHAHLHEVRWLAPQPMWGQSPAAANGAPARPAILRFASDAFMEELIAAMETRPEQLPAWLARPETWRAPMPGPDVAGLATQAPVSETRRRLTRIARGRGAGGALPVPAAPDPAPEPLKLYQPAQGRFYLVAASLVCQLPGLPDRAIERGNQESAGWLLRRLVPAVAGTVPDPEDPATAEYAWTAAPGVQGGYAWTRIPTEAGRARIQPEEERQALFPLTWKAGSGVETGRARRMLAGMIPVAKREAYLAAPMREPDAPLPGSSTPVASADPADDPRTLLFRQEVTAPWINLHDSALVQARALLDDTSADGRPAARDLMRRARAQAQTAGWFLLLDLATFLQTHMPRVWDALTGGAPSPALTAAETALRDALADTRMTDDLVDALGDAHGGHDIPQTLPEALEAITAPGVAEALEAAQIELDLTLAAGTDGWPGFLWMPAHPAVAMDFSPLGSPSAAPLLAGPYPPLDFDAESSIEALAALVAAALPATPAAPLPELSPPPAGVNAGEDAWYVIRCAYERPNCQGFARPVISRPSAPFQMASFFDGDAPTRPIRIPMPLDISPGALRRYKKGAGFVLSDMFCGQMGALRKLTFVDLILSVLPWPFHKDLPTPSPAPCADGGSNPFGLFISISIPIVTICAFVLMIIMVTLFDLIFRWLPWLIVAFPIPGLRGKKP